MENENLFQTNQENNNHGITNRNLFLKIWTAPRNTLVYILNNCPEKYVPLLFFIGGASSSIDRASSKGMGDHMSTSSILIISFIAGGLFGILWYNLYAWLLEVTGKWLKGTATVSQYKTILAWSSVPVASSVILLIPELYVFGDRFFKSEIYSNEWNSTVVLLIFGIIDFILAIWGLVILIKGISLVQNFSTGKSILNTILPALLIVVPIIILVILVGLPF